MGKKIIAVVLALLGVYTFLDAWNVVPGPLTTEPPPQMAQPYPTPYAQPEAVDLPEEPEASPPDAADVRELIDTLASHDQLTGRTAVLVTGSDGTPIADLHSTQPSIPASNMKIMTAAAALLELGPETTVPTIVTRSGDTLTLVGKGDVLLGAEAGDPTATRGRAGLADLADAVSKAVGTGSFRLAVDSSLFSGEPYHEDVIEGMRAYVMELRPLAIDRGFHGSGYSAHPDIEAAQVFADALAARGIEVTDVVRAQDQGGSEVARVESAPIRDIVDEMLVQSDNSLAEVLGHLVAIHRGEDATFAGAGRAVVQVLSEAGVNTDGVVISDASGLSKHNRLTPRAIADVLAQAWCEQCALTPIPPGLPVGGLDGTLQNRFTDMPVAGAVRAKTGTLVQATSLSGYVRTRSGYPLIFSIINDELEEGTAPSSRGAQEEFVDGLAALP